MKNLLFEHPRLWIAILIGSAAFFFLPQTWSLLSRMLVCWNVGVVVFIGLILHWMTRLTAAQICTKYIEEDESAPIILMAVIMGALLSLVAIVEPLANLKAVHGSARLGHFALAARDTHRFVVAGAPDVHHALRRPVL